MDDELKKRVADYFTGPELVDLLDVPTEILVDLLEEYIVEKIDELEEFICYGS